MIAGRRTKVILQLADVGTVNLGSKSKLLLRQFGFLACISQFFSKRHARSVTVRLFACLLIIVYTCLLWRKPVMGITHGATRS